MEINEYKRQIASIGQQRLAAEQFGATKKLENEILIKYMSELQQAIGDMSFVLDKNIYNENVTDEDMKIRRPDASVDDPLTSAGKVSSWNTSQNLKRHFGSYPSYTQNGPNSTTTCMCWGVWFKTCQGFCLRLSTGVKFL